MRPASFIPKIDSSVRRTIAMAAASLLALTIAHRQRLFLSARLAACDARRSEDAPIAPAGDVPQTPEQIRRAALARGIVIPAACAQSVASNLSLLSVHATRLRDASPRGPA